MRKFGVSAIFLAQLLAIMGCQQQMPLSAQVQFHQNSGVALSRLTERMSREIAVAEEMSRYPSRGVATTSPNPQSFFGIPWGINPQYSDPQIHLSYRMIAEACLSTIQNTPRKIETYAVTMVHLSRCLNNILYTQSLLFAWMYQTQDSPNQYRTGYSMAFPFLGTYGGYLQSQRQQQLNPLLISGLTGGGR